jgi:hypothetical protein
MLPMRRINGNMAAAALRQADGSPMLGPEQEEADEM